MIEGIGVDIVKMSRLKDKQERFAKFILTEKEYYQYESIDESRKLDYLCGRFAAKEAFVKAKGGIIRDYEIIDDNNGKPICKDGMVSISHDGDYAISFVVVTSKK